MAIERLQSSERDLVFKLAREITGTAFSEPSRHEVIITNVIRRVNSTHCSSLKNYLDYVAKNPDELDHMISAMTIHTTSWFREVPHFRSLEHRLRELGPNLIGQKFRFLSAACSTGEEVFSVGCVLESFRRQYVGFEYELYGIDLDPISLDKAKTAIYEIDKFDAVPRAYHAFFQYRKNLSERTFSVDAQIRKRSYFSKANLHEIEKLDLGHFDLIFCRNVLIYFKNEEVDVSVEKLLKFLKPKGYLSIGHCESIQARNFDVTCIGNSTYTRTSNLAFKMDETLSMHVLVVDDSKSVCEWVRALLQRNGIQCDTTFSAEEATLYLRDHAVDLVVLDFNLPGKSGVEWLTEQRAHNFQSPVVLLTDVHAEDAPQILEALNGLAQDYMNKSQVGSAPEEFVSRLKGIISSGRNRFENFDKKQPPQPTQRERPAFDNADLILVGASTGGTEAMSLLLANMPKTAPPIVCVQHIPVEFAQAFFKRLCDISGLKVGVCRHGQELLPGYIYMPLIDAHVGIRQVGDRMSCYLSNAEKIWSQRPSVDFLFQSASFLANKKVLAVLLTGMGKDGAAGMLELKKAGAYTMAQDQNSSLVWGMPGEAFKLGAVKCLGDVHQLREILVMGSTPKHSSRAG